MAFGRGHKLGAGKYLILWLPEGRIYVYLTVTSAHDYCMCLPSTTRISDLSHSPDGLMKLFPASLYAFKKAQYRKICLTVSSESLLHTLSTPAPLPWFSIITATLDPQPSGSTPHTCSLYSFRPSSPPPSLIS